MGDMLGELGIVWVGNLPGYYIPGRPSLYPLYSLLVRELLRTGTQNAKVRVIGPDTLRYTVYEDGSVYLLNTDYDTEYTVTLINGKNEEKIALSPLEIRHVRL